MMISRILQKNSINRLTINTINSIKQSSSSSYHTTSKDEVVSMSNIKRNDEFSTLTNQDIKHFKDILGGDDSSRMITDKDELEGFNQDWMKKYKGNSSLVLKPKTTDQVSKILSYCNQKKLAIVPQGGNTGLVGGSVPLFDEIILSLTNMNQIESFDDVTGVVTCQSGCVLETLESYLNAKGFTVPLDLGAKGSCHIGGNAATNAGGIRLLRYGSMHSNVLGIEAVLADGTIMDCNSTLRKDNTGYDLKHLFIGSEGTLGVITKISIITPPKPTSVNVALLACNDFNQIKQILIKAKKQLGDILSAFEFMDRPCIDYVLDHQSTAKEPFDKKSPFYVLIETSGFHEQHDAEKLNAFLENIMSEDLVLDGSLATDTKNISQFWKLRETITESLGKAGAVYKYDLSLPIDTFYSIVEVMREKLKDKAVVTGFGHVGDGNLHLNISTPKQKYSKEFLSNIEPFVYEYTSQQKGSISAEHGIGYMKTGQLHFSKSPASIQLMKLIKNSMDPNVL
ncbi:Putative actin interacting protein [Cavenderia fasciculata]|uniref:Actin interacting protein n=1 Tax=Cavenderia fasciculata TaxID=261658 RepID=F4QDX5_CACFS|nr:Putative actin interacting protein [Cavenderia fasciculata]EGG13922.1 Putative actin interacting protein [Cavenderia fasciculata]|eukprot:XP_004350630.1 Putative actin interacting protein [Cavenderia fasciculata]